MPATKKAVVKKAPAKKAVLESAGTKPAAKKGSAKQATPKDGGAKPAAKKAAPAGEVPTLPFESQSAWDAWLAKNHASSRGVWLKLAKKAAGVPSVNYAEALESALVWGWIDGQKDRFDDAWWLQKFTPRGPKSIWSKVNREKALALIDAGRMKPAGLAAVESAKQDGRWEQAYDSPSKATVPEDLAAAFTANPKAAAFFATLNSANRYAVLWRVQTAKKPETRARRIADLVAMLARNEKLHP